MKKWSFYLFICLALSSCEEKIAWNLHPTQENAVVVDALLTDEVKIQKIKLSRPIDNPDLQPQAVSNASVLVSTDQAVYPFHEDSLTPGTYLSDIAFSGVSDKTYSLLVSVAGHAYSAKAVLPSRRDFAFLSYQRDVDDGMYRITKVASVFDPSNPAMYEISLDWSAVPGYETVSPDSCKAKLFFYTLTTLDVSEVFAPKAEKVSFPQGTKISERRYSLTNEHAAFLRGVLLETNWQGGFFNTVPANLPTNLSSGAIGYFGACGIVEKIETVK